MPEVVFLAADPDQTVLSFLRRLCLNSGFVFRGARRGEDALAKARQAPPDLVVSRVRLPDMSGAELVTRFAGAGGPPVVVTALRGQEPEVAAALDLGALSVLFFPLDEHEVSVFVQGVLRWARRPPRAGIVEAGPVAVDLERGVLLRPAARGLTALEFELLRRLLTPPGRAVTRRQVPVGADRAVDVHVASLRAKLGPGGGFIETIRGIGYRWAACL